MWKLFSAFLLITSTPSCGTASATVHSYLSDHAFLYMSGHALLRKALLFVPRAERAYSARLLDEEQILVYDKRQHAARV